MKHLHLYVLALCVGVCLYFATGCTFIKVAGVPIAVGTGIGVVAGGGVPLLVAVVAAAGTWTAGAVVEKVAPPVYSGPPYIPPEVPWYDPATIWRYLIGYGLLILALWLLSKRFPIVRHGITAVTLGLNKAAAFVVDPRRRKKSPIGNVKTTIGEHPQ